MTQQQAEGMAIRFGCLRCKGHNFRRYAYSYDYQGGRRSEMKCVDCGMLTLTEFYPIPREDEA